MATNTNNTLRVGITGGIGSGKTTVCKIFAALGVPVYDADYWAKWLLQHDPELVRAVKSIFGAKAYNRKGEYNRSFIAKAVFTDKEKLSALNAIAHPAVEQHALEWHQEQAQDGCPYTIKEAALLIESGSYRQLDVLIVVTAPEETRIERVLKRDKMSEAELRARIQNQMPEARKVQLADAIIINDGQHSLVQQVWTLHQKILISNKK